MSNAAKQEAVQQMNEVFQKTPHVILAGYRGLSANDANALRAKVREVGGTYSVLKNRLARLAAPGTAVEPLAGQLAGPCALAAHESDPVALAKTIQDFSKEHPELEVIAGVIDAQQAIDAAGVKQLASLPGLDELRAQILAMIQTPATMLTRLVGTPGTQLARALDARREQQEGS